MTDVSCRQNSSTVFWALILLEISNQTEDCRLEYCCSRLRLVPYEWLSCLSISSLCNWLTLAEVTSDLWAVMALGLPTQPNPAWFCYKSFFNSWALCNIYCLISCKPQLRDFLQECRCSTLLLLFLNMVNYGMMIACLGHVTMSQGNFQ